MDEWLGMQAEVPGRPGEFLVFPFGLLWNEVTASSLLLVDTVCGLLLPPAGCLPTHAFPVSHR